MNAAGARARDVEPAIAEPPTAGPVIACIDDGPAGVTVARIGESLAGWLGADLVLATVQQADPRTPACGDLTVTANRHGRLVLARAARDLDQSAAIRVAIGEPAEKLLALAHSEAAGLLVVPATPRSRVRTRALGSVYLALAGAAHCPVVVVAPGVDTIGTTGPIVCGVDGSAPSLAAARVAAELAERLETRLVLVHSAVARSRTAPGVTGAHGAGRGRRHEEASRLLQGVADRLVVSVPTLLVVEHGPPAERLAHVARAESAQMLVTGSRGAGPIASALLGSVASKLAATVDRPLVVVPPDVRGL